jgi:uncharacterized protein (DUF2225 family)
MAYEAYKANQDKAHMDFWQNENVKCPHCGEEFNPGEHDMWELYDDDIDHDVDCPSCELEFKVRATAKYSFTTADEDGDF